MAKRGAWVSLDGYSATDKARERYRNFLSILRREKLLGRALLSHDHFWSVDGEGEHGTLKLANGAPNPFQNIFTDLIPDLRASGFTDPEIRQLTIENPAAAFTLRRRAQGAV